MRILVVSALYPPVVYGGYERECGFVVDHLRRDHEVLVLTGDLGDAPDDPGVRRELAVLSQDERGALRAPLASVRAVRSARRALAFKPDLVYVWSGAGIPQAALRVLADSGTPMAFRVCEHWFGGLFVNDQYLRELTPGARGPARRFWAALCRALNRAPGLRLDPTRRFPAAVSWMTRSVRATSGVPPAVEMALDRVEYSGPTEGERYEAIVRTPAPEPEILLLGRVAPEKGLEVAVAMLGELRRVHGIEARLNVVGPVVGNLREEATAMAERDGTAPAITWSGPLGPDGVAAALGRAHALVLPSTWQEPFGLVAIEAAFARVPVVASDVGGVGEGLRDEEHALLVPPGDAGALAAAVARVLTERDETAARVERAHTRAQDFRIAPFLERQSAFVHDAVATLTEATRRRSEPVTSGAGALAHRGAAP